eukprot:GILI01005423.1.p1 GENE.GILI01005423.1~~GILI01005423.1.p1  ORF type:complete len:1155 (-),score=318.74 GILI01005423.1:74-3235(-)
MKKTFQSLVQTHDKATILSEMTAPASASVLPSLPGSEIIGTGFDISKGFTLNSLTTAVLSPNDENIFPMTASLAFSYPSFEIARQIFDTQMETRVFENQEAENMNLAVSASIEVSYGLFKGTASGKVNINDKDATQVFISSSNLDVKMYSLYLGEIKPKDIHPSFQREFLALPLEWSKDPKAYQDFVRKWGTHIVKSVDVGGRLNMRGEVRNSEKLDGLQIAAQISLKFQAAALNVNAQAQAEYSRTESKTLKESSFKYTATGGDPAVAGMLASRQTSGAQSQADALTVWLESLKRVPKVYAYTLLDLPDVIFTGGDEKLVARRDALRQAISVYLSEGFINAVSSMIQPGSVLFSNFFQIATGKCLRFSASIAAGDKLSVVFTAVPSRLDTGYRVVVDTQKAAIIKGTEEKKSTTSVSALVPGNRLLYSIYFVCYSNGKIMYGRRDRTQMVFVDPEPQEVYFFGFDSRSNTNPIHIADLHVNAFSGLSCPGVFSTDGQYLECNGLGTCNNQEATCKCNDKSTGYACQYMCPEGLLGSPCSGASRGKCRAPAQQEQTDFKSVPAICDCTSPSILGNACQFDCPVGTNGKVCSARGNCGLKKDGSGAECACQSGVLGTACDFVCPAVDNKLCNGRGSCTLDNPAKPSKAMCVNCQVGFGGDDCRDINECENPNICGVKAGTCVNTEGSYECRCNPGYAFNVNTRICENINECNNPALNSCDKVAGICSDTQGGFECRCAFGYKGDGKTCTPADWFMSGVGGPLVSNLAFVKVGARCPDGTAMAAVTFSRGGANVLPQPPARPAPPAFLDRNRCNAQNPFVRPVCYAQIDTQNAAINAAYVAAVANWNNQLNSWRNDMINGGVKWEDGKVDVAGVNEEQNDREGLIGKVRCSPVPGGIAEGVWSVTGVGAPLANNAYFDRVGGECPNGQIARGFGFQRGGADLDVWWGQKVINSNTNGNEGREGLMLKLLCSAPKGVNLGNPAWVAIGTGAPMPARYYWDRVGSACPPNQAVAGIRFTRGGLDRDLVWTAGVIINNTGPVEREGLTMLVKCVPLIQ